MRLDIIEDLLLHAEVFSLARLATAIGMVLSINPKGFLDLLSRDEHSIVSIDVRLLTVLFEDISERDIGRVVLHQAKSRAARHRYGYVEDEIALSRFLLACQDTAASGMSDKKIPQRLN